MEVNKMVINKTIHIKSKGNCDMIDITSQITKEISNCNINDGIATIFISGSTAGISTIEYEDGLISDFKSMWDRNVPQDIPYPRRAGQYCRYCNRIGYPFVV